MPLRAANGDLTMQPVFMTIDELKKRYGIITSVDIDAMNQMGEIDPNADYNRAPIKHENHVLEFHGTPAPMAFPEIRHDMDLDNDTIPYIIAYISAAHGLDPNDVLSNRFSRNAMAMARAEAIKALTLRGVTVANIQRIFALPHRAVQSTINRPRGRYKNSEPEQPRGAVLPFHWHDCEERVFRVTRRFVAKKSDYRRWTRDEITILLSCQSYKEMLRRLPGRDLDSIRSKIRRLHDSQTPV